MTSQIWKLVSSYSHFKTKGDKIPSPVQGHETFIPAPGAQTFSRPATAKKHSSDSPGWMSVDQTLQSLCFGGFTGGRFRLQLFFRAVGCLLSREDSACQDQNPRTQWEGPFGIRQTPGFKVEAPLLNYLE